MNKSKIFMLVSISILIITIVAFTGTYAWYVWNTSEDEKTQIVTSIGAATIYYDGGSAITNAKVRPVSDKKNGIVKTINIKTNAVGSLTFNLYLDITSLDENLKHESFKYAFYKGESTTAIKEGNFTSAYLDSNTEDCTVNDGVRHIKLLENEPVSTTLTSYTLYIWIDGANYTNPIEMTGKEFSFNLHASGENAVVLEGKIPDITETIQGTLAHSLIALYRDADKTDTQNNGILYHLDTTNYMVSDLDGNLRYYGANPKNYIYFNCSDYSNQTADTCEIWRIIGVYDGKLKIMRNDSIGTMAWDQDKNQNSSLTTFSNNWETSSLQLMLNSSYYNGDTAGTITYYSGAEGDISTILDMSTVGIKNDTTRSMIAPTTWYLGGYSNSDVYPNEIYTYERTNEEGTTLREGNPFTIDASIGLLYASDYGYATDLSKCNKQLHYYNSSDNNYACRENNWLYLGNVQWLLNQRTKSSKLFVWSVTTTSVVSYQREVSSPYGVHPVLHLNSELIMDSEGNGTLTNPYRISIE